jgi:hypothetical protein
MDVNACVDAVLALLAPLGGTRLAYLPSTPPPPYPLYACTVDLQKTSPVHYGATIGDDTHDLFLDVFVVLGKNDDESAYRRLNDFISFPGLWSVKQTLQADRTLGGLAMTVQVGDPLQYGTHLFSQGVLLGVHFPLTLAVF